MKRIVELRRSSIAGVLFLDNRNIRSLSRAFAATCCGATKTAGGLLRAALLPDPRHELLRSVSIPFHTEQEANSINALEWLSGKARSGVRLGVNVRTRCIFKNDVLAAFPDGWYNIHHGLLPNHRGTSCDLHALVAGKTPGFSLHRMVERVDRGAIAGVYPIRFDGGLNYAGYLRYTQTFEAEALHEWLTRWEETGSRPAEFDNNSSDIHWHKTPSAADIFRLRWRRGVTL